VTTMPTTATATSTSTGASTQRLLGAVHTDYARHAAVHGQLPHLGLDELLGLVEASGLTGRGGAAFPTSIKVRAVASGARRPVVVGNAMEGEPLSHKDAVLLDRNPHLVLDGLQVLARALRARRAVLAVGPELNARPAKKAARGRGGIEVIPLAGGFVAGQETALVNQLNGRAPIPRDPLVRVTERGVDGRPTLVLNVETLAHVALIARHGPEWFRSLGTPEDSGTSLFTVTGAVRRPGVVEAARGSRLSEVLAATDPRHPLAVLVGGYHGAWVPSDHCRVRLTRSDLSPWNAAVGAGVLHVIDDRTCPLRFAAEVADYLAGESAAQCGPCINGLPQMASDLHRLAACVRDPRLPDVVGRMASLVKGRGACAHPDGTARFVDSTLTVFRDHSAAHLQGWCPSRMRTVS
jgi:NADH:ubiquinone oxidoreductase subunit F (NADH-binding)